MNLKRPELLKSDVYMPIKLSQNNPTTTYTAQKATGTSLRELQSEF